MQDVISIIVPVFNSCKTIGKCLASLLSQTYITIEIIIVNDGSTDNSYDICRKYQDDDSRIILINKENGGVSSARNVGLKHCTGRYITFVDSDDIVDMFYIQKLYRTAIDYQADIVIQPAYGRETKEIGLITSLSGQEACKDMFEGDKFAGQVWGKLFKKEVFNDISFPENIAIREDMVVCMQVFLKVKTIIFQNEGYYKYIETEGSALRNNIYKSSFSTIQLANNILYSLAKESAPNCIELVQNDLVICDLSIAIKQYKNGIFSKAEYKKLINHSRKYISKNIFSMMRSKAIRILAHAFNINYSVFIFCLKMLIKLNRL